MFIDFDKVFNEIPQTQLRVPDAMVTYLNTKLPKGIKYNVDSDGNCVVVSETGDSFSIKGYYFNPTPEEKKILGENYTPQDVKDFFYNMQKPIPLVLEEEGYILLNEERFPIERLVYNPYNPIKYVAGSLCLVPQPFPPPFTANVSNGEVELEVMLQRVPDKSVHVAVFESKKDHPFFIRLRFNESNNNIAVDFTLNISLAKSIKEIVSAVSIYNGFFDGKSKLFDKPFDVKPRGKASKYDEESLSFWRKVLQIEEALDISFVPPNEGVDFTTICLVEEIYQNIINHNPIRDRRKISTLDGKWDMVSQDLLDKSVGTPIFFEFEAVTDYELFGVKFQLPRLVLIFDTILEKYTFDGSGYKLYLEDISPEKPQFISSMAFKTEEEMKSCKAKEHIGLFHDSKRVSEYLK